MWGTIDDLPCFLKSSLGIVSRVPAASYVEVAFIPLVQDVFLQRKGIVFCEYNMLHTLGYSPDDCTCTDMGMIIMKWEKSEADCFD